MFLYGFMQRAFWAGGLIAVVTPILGLFLILRRQSLMADTLSHISLAGVALGFTLGAQVNLVTIIIVTIGAVGIEMMRRVYQTYSEVSIAILMAAGLSVALVLMSLNEGGMTANIDQYLFGSIITIDWRQLTYLAIITVLVIISYLIFKRPLYVLTFDEDTAFTSGLPTRLMSTVFSILTGLTIAVMLPIVGALLVSALVVLPAAIGIRFVKSFSGAIIIGIIVAALGMFFGLSGAYAFGTPPGATVTLLLVIILIVSLAARRLAEKLRYRRNQ